MTVRRSLLAAAAFAVAGSLSAASAADLRLGVSSPATTLDPHSQNLITNLALSSHIIDTH